MAELTHFYAEDNTLDSHTGDTNWTTGLTISGASLSANTKYLIVARALHGGDAGGGHFGCRVQTDDDSNIETKSEQIVEPQNATSTRLLAYMFVHSFTTDASPADINLQHATLLNTGDTSYLDQMTLFVLDLDAIGSEGTDYHEDIQAVDTGTDFSDTAQTMVITELSGTDLGTDEWLILGYGRCDGQSTVRYWDISLYACLDTSTQALVGQHRREGEDTVEQGLAGFATRHQASSGTPNATIYGLMEISAAGHSDGGGYMIALPTSLFADFNHEYTATATAISSETTIESLASYTPTTNGNHLVIGYATTGAGTGVGAYLWVEDSTTEIRTGDSATGQTHSWDSSKDMCYTSTLQRYSISSTVTLNLQADWDTNPGNDFMFRRLLVINLNEAAAPDTEPNGTVEASVEVQAVGEQTHKAVSTVEVAAATSAAVRQVHKPTSTVEVGAETSGDVDVFVPLNATVEAGVEASAAPVQTHEQSGTVEAGAEISADLDVIQQLDGTVEAGVEASGAASLVQRLVSTLEAGVEAAAVAVQTHEPAATVETGVEASAAAVQVHEATATVETGAETSTVGVQVHEATATVEAGAEWSGDVDVFQSLTGTVETGVEVAAVGVQVHKPASTVEAGVEVAGTVTTSGTVNLSGTVEAGVEAAATAVQIHEPAATVEAGTELSAAIRQVHELNGTVEAGLEASSTVDIIGQLVAALETGVEVSGDLTVSVTAVNLTGVIETAVEASAALDVIQALTGLVEWAVEADGTSLSVVGVTTKGFVTLTDENVTGLSLLEELVSGLGLSDETVTGLAMSDL